MQDANCKIKHMLYLRYKRFQIWKWLVVVLFAALQEWILIKLRIATI
jgi:hypothetical protein